MRSGTLFALLLVLICNVGCLPSVTTGQIGRATGGAPVSFNYMGGGEGESFWIAPYDDVIAATLRAGDVLALELKEKNVEQDQAFIRFYDTKKEGIRLFIERRTDTMKSIKFDVGWFGSIAFGRLMSRQIINELNDAGSFLEDWTY